MAPPSSHSLHGPLTAGPRARRPGTESSFRSTLAVLFLRIVLSLTGGAAVRAGVCPRELGQPGGRVEGFR